MMDLFALTVTCIFTFPSSSLILNVENEAPIVGAISHGFISQTYCLMRLLLPTPKEKKAIHFMSYIFW